MYTRLNTVILLDEKYIKKLIKLALQISKGRETEFVIDNKNYFAHLTIYSPEYPTKNINKIIEGVKDLSNQTKPFSLKLKTFISGEGFVIVDFYKNKNMESIHRKAVKILNHLREGRIRDKYKSEIEAGKYPQEQIELINKYGYHNVLENYRPHLSMCKFVDQGSAEWVVDRLNQRLKHEEIPVKKIAVSEMGLNGTCTKILAEFILCK